MIEKQAKTVTCWLLGPSPYATSLLTTRKRPTSVLCTYGNLPTHWAMVVVAVMPEMTVPAGKGSAPGTCTEKHRHAVDVRCENGGTQCAIWQAMQGSMCTGRTSCNQWCHYHGMAWHGACMTSCNAGQRSGNLLLVGWRLRGNLLLVGWRLQQFATSDQSAAGQNTVCWEDRTLRVLHAPVGGLLKAVLTF
jgi:hypothetical protein